MKHLQLALVIAIAIFIVSFLIAEYRLSIYEPVKYEVVKPAEVTVPMIERDTLPYHDKG